MSGLIDASILKPELANSLAEGYRQSRKSVLKREMDREHWPLSSNSSASPLK